MVATNEITRSGMLFQTRCKCWGCPDCAKINADLWQLRLTFGAQRLMESGKDIHLVTVTAHERHSVKRAVEVLPSGWDKLRKRWARSGDKPEYALIPEIGGRGHFHIHLITDSPRGTRWWKDTARSCGFGYSNDESDRFINAARAGFYGGKYLAKQLNDNVWKKGFHRVRTSHGWPKLPNLPKSDDWRFRPWPQNMAVPEMARSLVFQGYDLAVADDKASWFFISTGELTPGCQALTIGLPSTSGNEGKTDGFIH